jgi:proline dehydrogenase
MQASIESFGQQMTHRLNIGDKHIVMNGYQCYLKRMREVISHEIECSKKLGYNLGLKLIRGAYMTEERTLAKESGVESPVWDTVEATHSCYNDCLKLAVENVKENSLVFVASHNPASVNIAKSIIL